MHQSLDLISFFSSVQSEYESIVENNVNPKSFFESLDRASSLSEIDRNQLISHLVRIEIRHFQKTGQQVDSGRYASMFPELSADHWAEFFQTPEFPDPAYGFEVLPSKYTSKTKIGQGGLGVVWRVYDTAMKRSLAIKTIKKEFSGHWNMNQRLANEAILSGQLQHPGVPPIYEQGFLESGDRYFSMKLVEGKTLAQILPQSSDTPFLIQVFEQVAQTLAFAHSRGIIHRDLKPQNIMVGQFGEVQLMDWGLAKKLDNPQAPPTTFSQIPEQEVGSDDTVKASYESSIAESRGFETKQGSLLGTVAYMSPEQASGNQERIDRRTDVFSLGCVLFEILTGTRFLTRQQSLLSIDNIATGNWDPPADRLADSAIDEELKSLCVACLSHDRSGRPASAEEVATTIAEYQASVQTRLKKSEIEKASLLIRTSEQQKRFRIVGMLSAMIAVVSLIGIVAFGFANQRYRQAARKASIELKTRKELGDFFVLDFIQNANPEIQPDNNLKVKTLLGRAAKQVGKRFSHRPEIEREIRQNLALSFAGLGEFHQAKQQAEIVLQRCQEDLGPESLETWEAKLALATIESRLDSSGSTMDAIQEIEERFKNATGDGREFYFHARLLRASTLISQSQFDKANQIVDELEDQFDLAEDAELQSQLVDLLIRKAIAQLELANYSECRKIISKIYAAVPSRKFFNEQGDLSDNADLRSLQHYIICKNIEGNLLEYEGNFKESESLYENLLKIEKPLLGSEHPLTLNILHNMSMSKMKLGKIKESLDLLKPLGPISIRSLGESQEDSIRIRNAIASCHTMLGNTKEAIDEFKSLENVLTQLHRQPHHDVISNYHNQGELHRKIGNLKESERYLTMALKDSTSLFGIEHPRTLVTLAGLAHTHAKQKKFDVAETEYLKALQASYQILGKQHPDSLITLDDLCRMYRDSGQFEKAAQRLAEQLAIRKSFAPDANETISTAGNLGATYCRIEEFEKAIPLLEKSVKHRRENMGPENPRTLSRVRTLIKAYLGNDEFESIVKLTDEQISLIQSLHRPFDQNRLKAYRGYAQFRLGKAEAAESDLLGAYRWFEENPNQDKRSSEATFVKKQLAEYLIELYVSLGEDDSRDFWQSEFERIRNE